MADNILKQLYKNTESVSKDIKSMDTTLSKLLKLEQKQEKFDKKKDKEEASLKKKEKRNQKRKAADFQGFKGIAKMKKSEKDKEKNSLMDLLMGGLGKVIGGIGGALSSIGGTITAALGGLSLGGILTGAIAMLGPALIAAASAAAIAAIVSPEFGKKMSEGLNSITQTTNQAAENAMGGRHTDFQNGTQAAWDRLRSEYTKENMMRTWHNDPQMSDAEFDKLKEKREQMNDLRKIVKSKENMEIQLERIEENLKKTEEELGWMTHGGNYDGWRKRMIEMQGNLKENIGHQHTRIKAQEEFIRDNTDLDTDQYLSNTAHYIKRQTGGHINVPGSGEGDKVPMLLPQGSFVLNKMASMHFQTGGMVPTLLEPGEKVFMPGDWDSAIEQLNGVIPRFQTGGYVGAPRSSMTDTGEVDYKGRKVLLSPAAAAGWEAMMAAGMPYNPQDITNVYRDAAEYQRLLKAGYGAAANSAHNHGEAADIHGAMNTWIRQNGSKFGWAANDYTGTHGGHFEYVGDGAGTGPRVSGEVEAAAESITMTANGLMGSMGNAFTGAFEGLSAFGEGFAEGFGNTIDKSNPIVDMISGAIGGISSTMSSIGNLFGGGGGDNPLTNLLGGNNASSPNGTGPIDMGSDVNAKLKKMAGYAMQAGFTKEQAKTMAAIAGGESTFDNRAHNDNRATKDDSYGLWQINMFDKLGPERRRKYGLTSNEQLFDPVTNARVAKAIFDAQGYGAWGAYGDGNAAKYMNAAQALKLQNGGMVPTPSKGVVTRKTSSLTNRMNQAQSKFSQGISLSVKPIIVYEDEKPTTISADADISILPPDLPNGPGTAMAADYFYQLSLGNQ